MNKFLGGIFLGISVTLFINNPVLMFKGVMFFLVLNVVTFGVLFVGAMILQIINENHKKAI